jgi:hypothetical protein
MSAADLFFTFGIDRRIYYFKRLSDGAARRVSKSDYEKAIAKDSFVYRCHSSNRMRCEFWKIKNGRTHQRFPDALVFSQDSGHDAQLVLATLNHLKTMKNIKINEEVKIPRTVTLTAAAPSRPTTTQVFIAADQAMLDCEANTAKLTGLKYADEKFYCVSENCSRVILRVMSVSTDENGDEVPLGGQDVDPALQFDRNVEMYQELARARVCPRVLGHKYCTKQKMGLIMFDRWGHLVSSKMGAANGGRLPLSVYNNIRDEMYKLVTHAHHAGIVLGGNFKASNFAMKKVGNKYELRLVRGLNMKKLTRDSDGVAQQTLDFTGLGKIFESVNNLETENRERMKRQERQEREDRVKREEEKGNE